MLNMRSTAPNPADLSTRARIRDAAVLRFALDGFGTPVRAIAAEAAVSAALVMHHFGTKDALRAECDTHVLEQIRIAKAENTQRAASGGDFFHAFAMADGYGAIVGYVLRSMQDGSDVGRHFVASMIADVEGYAQAAVDAGIARPSRDEKARARYLVMSTLGSLWVGLTLDPPTNGNDVTVFARRYFQEHYLPMIELFTEGCLTSRQMLDEYLLYIGDPPREHEPPDTSFPEKDAS